MVSTTRQETGHHGSERRAGWRYFLAVNVREATMTSIPATEARTAGPPLRRVSRPALVAAIASSTVVAGAALAGFQFTLPSFLAALAGCGVILGLGFTGGKVERPILEPLEGDWETGVHVDAPSARQLVAVDPPAA